MAERDYSFNATTTTPITSTPHSPWHSPVPYLFGGLAAMLGLIAFALLILACSYWKLSGYLYSNGEASGEGENRDLEAGELGENQKMGAAAAAAAVLEQKFLVIMAGDLKPTFLATPISNSTNSSSSAENNQVCRCNTEKVDKSEETQESSS